MGYFSRISHVWFLFPELACRQHERRRMGTHSFLNETQCWLCSRASGNIFTLIIKNLGAVLSECRLFFEPWRLFLPLLPSAPFPFPPFTPFPSSFFSYCIMLTACPVAASMLSALDIYLKKKKKKVLPATSRVLLTLFYRWEDKGSWWLRYWPRCKKLVKRKREGLGLD